MMIMFQILRFFTVSDIKDIFPMILERYQHASDEVVKAFVYKILIWTAENHAEVKEDPYYTTIECM